MDIQEQITGILVERIGISPSEVTPEASFTKDLGLDSLDYAEIVMEFETSFNIKIPDQDAEHLSTIRDAVTYIQQQLAERHSSQ